MSNHALIGFEETAILPKFTQLLECRADRQMIFERFVLPIAAEDFSISKLKIGKKKVFMRDDPIPASLWVSYILYGLRKNRPSNPPTDRVGWRYICTDAESIFDYERGSWSVYDEKIHYLGSCPSFGRSVIKNTRISFEVTNPTDEVKIFSGALEFLLR